MFQYLINLANIYHIGHSHPDRTKTGRRSMLGLQTRYLMEDGLALVTTRKIFTGTAVDELIWFIQGKTNVRELGVKTIWDPWAVTRSDVEKFIDSYMGSQLSANGIEGERKSAVDWVFEDKGNEVGPMYGAAWRNAPRNQMNPLWPKVPMNELPSDKMALWQKQYDELVFFAKARPVEEKTEVPSFEDFCLNMYYRTVDQLNELVRNLKARPYSSRLLVTAWIPEHVPFEELSPQENVILGMGSLAACHAFFQCFVTPPDEEHPKPRLTLLMYQRSADYPVGVPYNLFQYSVLLHMLAHVCDMEPYELIHSTGDSHIYENQMAQVPGQVDRNPMKRATLWLNPDVKDLFAFTKNDIKVIGYESHDRIDYPVSV